MKVSLVIHAKSLFTLPKPKMWLKKSVYILAVLNSQTSLNCDYMGSVKNLTTDHVQSLYPKPVFFLHKTWGKKNQDGD